jgi:hypothetical protein
LVCHQKYDLFVCRVNQKLDTTFRFSSINQNSWLEPNMTPRYLKLDTMFRFSSINQNSRLESNMTPRYLKLDTMFRFSSIKTAGWSPT